MRRAHSGDRASPGQATGGLPDGLLTAARAWRRIDADRYRFMAAALGTGDPTQWSSFRESALAEGVAVRDPDGESLTVLDPIAVPLAGVDEHVAPVLRRLLDHWLTGRDPVASVAALGWAVALQDWEAIDARWLFRLQHVHLGRDPQVQELLGGLPIEARQVNPLLTWAWGAAGSLAAPKGSSQAQTISRLVGDAVGLHAQWRNAATVDTAVAAGCIWMMAQRFLPTSPPSAALDGAWETQREVSEYIARHRRLLNPPGPAVEATFRAASARIALARADLRHVLVEAQFALALDPEIAGPMVRGGANVALELMGFGSETADRPFPNEVGPGIGIAFQDAVSERLARSLARIRQLDQPGLLEAMIEFDDMPIGSPGWSGVVFLHQVAGALWGDPEAALTRTDALAARHALVWQEQRGALGQILLARGRVALLNRIGSYRAAYEVARALPPLLRRPLEAQVHLWSGALEEAAQVAADGLHDPETNLAERALLLTARAAALALDPLAAPVARAAAARSAVDACLEHGLWIALALVPPEARTTVIELGLPSGGRPDATLLSDRLALLAADARRAGRVTLSRREQVLLPLLATAQTVPEIAATLQVSPNTVRNQVATLRAKFGAASRQELVQRARTAGLL